MADAVSNSNKMTEKQINDLVIESDSGARRPRGIAKKLLFILSLSWALFQLWISSPLPYYDFVTDLHLPIFNSTEARFIHLTFALSLTFLAYPAFRNSPRRYVPFFDWLFFILACTSVLYLYFFKNNLADRAGLPNNIDITMAILGIILLLEAARRALGPPLVIIAVVFLVYTFAGSLSFIPDVIAHKGQSLSKVASHQWLSSQGVFGVALGVSTDFVFLFVLFGALLEKAGAGNFFIKLAFSMLGHFRGGPAKAAVLASGLTGLISGSSIANTVTTGTFTIPLMRKVGFSPEKSGATEVASSVNGQIMPPVMGAAAFLMVEYIGVPYVEVVKAAFIPALISYIALIYIVHLEALKADIKPLKKAVNRKFHHSLIISGITVSSILIIAGIIYYLITGIKYLFTDSLLLSNLVIITLMILTYLVLVKVASKRPDLEAMDDNNGNSIKLPETLPTLLTGLHYILPIIVLVWSLMIERLSPGLSAFWATFFMVIILLTQKPLLSFFRNDNLQIKSNFKEGLKDVIDGLITGSRNMVGIGVATAAAGIIVGSVSLTGVGQVLTELVEIISGGSFVMVLIFTALICLVLGMGLPTTANYIVVSSLMVTVIEELGSQNGMHIPLIAVHLFVFYFGIMADVTPPVGLASFAASAISGGDPIRTGLQAFFYSIRTVILPFIFIYNTELLLYNVDSFIVGFYIFIKSTFAILVFAAATQGYFLMKSKLYESFILLLVAFALFRPGFWVDIITPPFSELERHEVEEIISDLPVGSKVRLGIKGEDEIGEEKNFMVYMPILTKGSAKERFENFGIFLMKDKNNDIVVSDLGFNSKAENLGVDFDNIITSFEVSNEQIKDFWIYICALIGFFFVYIKQRARKSEIVEISKK